MQKPLPKGRVSRINQVLAREQKKVAKRRDELDSVIGELEELREHCREAWDHLQDARDSLSRLV